MDEPRDLVDRIRDCVKRECGVRSSEILLPTTRLGEDLGLYGADAIEFLLGFAKEFQVDLSEMVFPRHFAQEHFLPIWLFRRPPWWIDYRKYSVNVEHLIRVAEIGRWFCPPRNDEKTGHKAKDLTDLQ